MNRVRQCVYVAFTIASTSDAGFKYCIVVMDQIYNDINDFEKSKNLRLTARCSLNGYI